LLITPAEKSGARAQTVPKLYACSIVAPPGIPTDRANPLDDVFPDCLEMKA
jgi:hypothetical protein